jgi:MoaA/NifB/PqqE/SkfB family radical SAM enzyme
MFKVTSRWPHQDNIKIEWNLGKRCNYDCSYCPSSIHDNNSEHTDIEILKLTVDKLMLLGKPIRLSFTGGEPTVHPNFEELINYCKHVGVGWVSVTSNGTRQAEWYINQRADYWVFSLHFEHDWNRVANTISAVSKLKQKQNMMVNIMAHHDKMAEVKDVAGYFDTVKVPYVIRRIRWTEGDHNIFDDMRYHPDDYKWIMNQEATVTGNCVIDKGELGEQIIHANDVIKLHLNKYKGWTCNAGIESLMINWDGEVHRATCRVGGSLGNIYNNTFIAPTEPITCTRDWCTCAADIPLTKTSVLGPQG